MFNRRQALALGGSGLLWISRSGNSRAAGAAYTVTEMTSAHAGSWSAVASAINRKGVIAGYLKHGKQSIAVRSERDELIELPADDGIALALGLADGGDVVGSVDDRAAIWSDGRLRLLAQPDEPQTTATALHSGLVVGQTQSSTTSASALVWSGDDVRVLPSLGGPMSRAAGVNPDGIIVGRSTEDDDGNNVRAVVWRDGKITSLGTLGGNGSDATAINASGAITGCARQDESFGAIDIAMISVNGTMTALTRLGPVKLHGRKEPVNLERSVGLAINDRGTICGISTSVSENNPLSVATLWRDDAALDLNALIGKIARDVLLVSADGINTNGELVCTGYRYENNDPGRTRIYRLTPR